MTANPLLARRFLRPVAFALTLFASGGAAALAANLDEDFANPPMRVRPYVWWHWMGSNVSKEGIAKDLEVMKASGIGGATIFNLPSGITPFDSSIGNPPWPEITYRSPKYWEMVQFATAEAKRLGLELGMHNCAGYSATGGPWVTPDISMQKYVFTTTPVKGPVAYSGMLRRPSATRNYYRDIAVLALPAGDSVDPSAIVDLSSKMEANGRFTWQTPAGSWVVYRIGHTSMGNGPHPCPEDVKGALEVDKMNAPASKFHYQEVIRPLEEHLGKDLGATFRHLTLDSYEAGSPTWTPLFREEFRKRKGYDPVPRLPGLELKAVGEGGKRHATWAVVIGGTAQNERFKADFLDVVQQLYQECNFEPGARMMEEAGLQMNFEPYGGPFDPMAGSATAHIPMGEFWVGSEGRILSSIAPAARAAGRTTVGAEAFTGVPKLCEFSETPALLKPAGDGAYAAGVNRLVLHSWTHQPFGDAFKPGYSMGGWGTHFGRNQTWAEPGKAFFQYLGRTQALLQRGEGVGDFLALDCVHDWADSIPHSALLSGNLRVEDGQLVLPSGRRYPFLALPPDKSMLPEVARKLRELVEAGATIVGSKPSASPSLSGYPGCDDEVCRIANELWGDGKGGPDHRLGKGKVFGGSLVEFQRRTGFLPTLKYVGKTPPKLRATARREGDTAIFFFANIGDTPCELTPSFRIQGKQPEIWNAEDGSHFAMTLWQRNGERTEVPLALGAHQALFVVFRNPVLTGDHPVSVALAGDNDPAPAWSLQPDAAGRAAIVFSRSATGMVYLSSGASRPIAATAPAPVPVEGAWEVSFAPGMGAPEKATLPQLQSWSENADKGIKYFSGTAIYRKTVEIPESVFAKGNRMVLDLGKVSNLAAVKVNGNDLGVCWVAPFTRNATAALKPGKNTLEIAVTNTWANRLIGDEQEPADVEWKPGAGAWYPGQLLAKFPDWLVKGQPRPSENRRTFCTWNYFSKDSPLLPAGLLGPIVVRVMPEVGL